MKKILLWVVFFVNLGVIGALWWLGSASYIGGSVAAQFIAYGRLAGLLAEYLILVQLTLVGRIRSVERLYGFDKLNAVHRWLGFFILGLLLIHPIALSFGYAALSSGTFSVSGAFHQFLIFLTSWQYVILAFIALILFIVIISISVAVIRKRLRYETWYFIHLGVYVAIGLAFAHQIQTADVSNGWPLSYWLALNFVIFGLVLIYRFIRPSWLFFKHRFYIEKIVQETPTVYSLYIRGRALTDFHFDAGQFANLIFLAKGMWYSHPFSFSAAYNGEYLRFSIKEAGDFTENISQLKSGTKVFIDGPYGRFTEAHARSVHEKFLFIAGGIGITPIRAMAEDAHRQGDDALILYGARAENELAFKNELAALRVPVTTFISGFIDEAAIQRSVPDVTERDVYVCGPLPMMRTVIAALQRLGVPHHHIHYETFAY